MSSKSVPESTVNRLWPGRCSRHYDQVSKGSVARVNLGQHFRSPLASSKVEIAISPNQLSSAAGDYLNSLLISNIVATTRLLIACH